MHSAHSPIQPSPSGQCCRKPSFSISQMSRFAPGTQSLKIAMCAQALKLALSAQALKLALSATAVVMMTLMTAQAHATQNIEFPEEELATESVLPIFDQPVSVKNRAVVMGGKFEGELMGGYSLTEAFFNPVIYGLSVTYHVNDTSGINIFGLVYAGGLSDKGKALNGGVENSAINANLQYGPQNKYLLLVNYEFSAYYGKISITKDYVMNLNLYGLAGIGGLAIGDGTVPVASLGIGQKFYFTNNFSFRADLRFLFYEGPNILSSRLDQSSIHSVQPNSYFSNKFFADGLMTVGVDYLLP